MEIRKRLTLQFTLIVAIILFIAELSVYLFSEIRWKEDFTNRLRNKATAVTNLLLDVEEVDADLLRLIEKNNLYTLPFEEIHIFDRNTVKIFSSRDSSHLVITPALIRQVEVDKSVELSQGKYSVVGFLYSGKYDRMVVIAGAIDVYGLRKLANLRTIFIIVFLSSLIILLISGRVFANRALKPILKVMDEVLAITESTLHLRVNEGNGKDEIARLAGTFNRMLERLETAFKIQRSFIANASHEIRTPLSHITGQLGVGLLKERSNEEYVRLIQSVLDDIIELGNTANRLLLLTMTDSDVHHIPMDSVRLDEILWEAQAELHKTHPDFKADIQFEGEFESENLLTIKGNDQLLKIASLNLMENGCKYSGNHTVMITIESLDSSIRVRFRDDGVGIPEEEQQLIFEPFYRAKNVENIQGSGLGLSLVQRITLLHRGSITMKSELGKGSEFTLVFPNLPN